MKNKDGVLVITDDIDTHADIIYPKLEKTGLKVFRFNTNQLDRYRINLRPEMASLSVIEKGSGKEFISDEVGAVWYRRPSPDKNADDLLDEDGLKFFKGETKEFVKSLTFTLKHCFWVTAPWLLYEARIKSRQLSVARDAGLSVPKTLITMDQDLVRGFYSKCHNGMVAKPLKVPFVESKEAYYTLRVQEIKQSDLENPSLYVCPTVFQEKILVSHELRIVAIGRRLFAFKVVRKSGGSVDIRTGGLANVEYSACEIPDSLRDKILNLLSQFNIPFSSMDFLVDHDGNEYFVDLNPNGQWLWLETTTGIIMSDLFVEMLVSHKMPT